MVERTCVIFCSFGTRVLLKDMASIRNRRDFLKVTGTSLSSLPLVRCSTSGDQRSNRPNVIVIMTDDQGYGDLGMRGNPYLKTPNLDQLAAESVELSRFYCEAVCAPTRASLLTGRYYYRTGVGRERSGI